MLKKIVNLLKSCLLFWKNFLFSKQKKEFAKENSGILKTQALILLSSLFTVFVLYQSMKPVAKGVCRIVLQSNEDLMGGFRGRPVGVEAKKIKTGVTLREIKSIGVLKGNQQVIIKSEINGKIDEVLFVEGSEVTRGQDLIRFEDDLYKSEKEKHEAEYILKKSEFERIEKLYKQKVGSQKAYDEAFAHMQEAKAQLESATFQLSRTVIKAPFDGVIGILKGIASPGNVVQQHADLVSIVDNSKVKVEFMIPAKYVGEISVGQNVEITVDSFKGRAFSGVVDAIDSEIDSRSHSILVRAVIPNKNKILRHGMFSNVKLITGEKSDVVLVEDDALDREGSIEFVWIIDDKGRAYRKRVLTGAKDASGVEIVAGLKEGDIVVMTGQLKLTDGSKTKILNKKDFEEDIKENSEENTDSENENDDNQNNDDKNEEKSLLDQDPEKENSENNNKNNEDENNKDNQNNDDKNEEKSLLDQDPEKENSESNNKNNEDENNKDNEKEDKETLKENENGSDK